MAKFEVDEHEGLRQVHVILNDETVRSEAGALSYMVGKIKMESKVPSVAGFIKAMATSESVFRPTYTGTGDLYLEPSPGGYHLLEIGKKEEWILERGAFWVSDGDVEVDIHRDKMFTSLLSGQGFLNFQTKVRGPGTVVLATQGPVKRLDLQNGRLVVDGSFAVARTANLDYAVEKATKSLFGSASSGEFLVSTYSGTGTVLVSPVPYWQGYLANAISGMVAMTTSHK